MNTLEKFYLDWINETEQKTGIKLIGLMINWKTKMIDVIIEIKEKDLLIKISVGFFFTDLGLVKVGMRQALTSLGYVDEVFIDSFYHWIYDCVESRQGGMKLLQLEN